MAAAQLFDDVEPFEEPEFHIPLTLDDLIEPGEDKYVVGSMYSAQDLKEKIPEICDAAHAVGSAYIKDSFEVLFSALRCFEELTLSSRRTMWECIFEGLRALAFQFSGLLETVKNDQEKDKNKQNASIQNAIKSPWNRHFLKMHVYVSCTAAELLENAARSKDNAVKVAKQTKNKKGTKALEDVWDGWQNERLRLMTKLCDLLSLPLKEFFTPPVVPQDLLNLVAKLCSLLLKDPAIAHQKNNEVRTRVFDVMCALFTENTFNQECVFELVQAVQNFEHFGPVLAEGIAYLDQVKNYRYAKMLAKDIIKEIANSDPLDPAQDAKSAKYYSTFFSHLARRVPEAFVPNLNDLAEHLEGEAYNMRIGVLTAFKEAIKADALSDEEKTEEKMAIRDEYFAYLEDHSHDVSSYVRKDVMLMFMELASPRNGDTDQYLLFMENGAPLDPVETFIPVSKYQTVLNICCERLLDKSSSVRKAAILLLRYLAIFSPFHGQTLAGKELAEKLDKAKKELEEAEKQWQVEKDRVALIDQAEAVSAAQGGILPATDAWTRIMPTIFEIFSHASYAEGSKVSRSLGRPEAGPLRTPMKKKPDPPPPAVDQPASQPLTQFTQATQYDGFSEEAQMELCRMFIQGQYLEVCEALSEFCTKFPNDEFFHSLPGVSEDILRALRSSRSNQEEENGGDVMSERGMMLFLIAQKTFALHYDDVVPNVQLKLPGPTARTPAEVEADDKIRRLADKGGEPSDLAKRRRHVRYLREARNYVETMKKCMSTLCLLLKSATSSDVTESIKFFVDTYSLNLEGSLESIRKMLFLVFSKESSIMDAVRTAYQKLYLNVPLNQNYEYKVAMRKKNIEVARNLSKIIVEASLGELNAFGVLMEHFYIDKSIDLDIVAVLWDRFTLKIAGTTEDESRCALLLLGMLAKAEPKLVEQNVDIFMEYGLKRALQETDEGIKSDFGLARDTLKLMMKLAAKDSKTKKAPVKESKDAKKGAAAKATEEVAEASAPVRSRRFAHDHLVFEAVEDLLVKGFFMREDKMYGPMSQTAVEFIYAMAENPGILNRRIASAMYRHTRLISKPETATEEEIAVLDKYCPDRASEVEIIGSKLLARLLNVVGHMAFKMADYLEVEVSAELKRREAIMEAKEEKNKKKKADERKKGMVKATPAQANSRRSNATILSAISMAKNKKYRMQASLYEYNADGPGGDGDIDAELGLTGAAAEDIIADRLRKINDEKLVTGDGLFAKFGPIIQLVCREPAKFCDEELRAAAIIALGKFMLVSRPFCDANLTLFFTILEKSKEENIRANSIIVAADLAVRFPNLLEPWTLHMYSRLTDSSLLVRSNALTVLSQLILNDMVKVKGQISQVARCLVDENSEIASCAEQFFMELSKKKNTLYNALPDVISCLSDPERGLDKGHFRVILKKILGLVDKDKQMEQLVDKLCSRLRVVENVRQWEDLSFCLGLLQYNDKALKKVIEQFSAFHGKLHEDEVYNSLMQVLNKSKTSLKEAGKAMVEELDELIQKEREKNLEAVGALGRAQGMKQPAKKGGRGKDAKSVLRSNRPRRLMRKDNQPEDDDDEEEEEQDEPRPSQIPKRPVRASRGRAATAKGRRNRLPDSDDDDDEEEEEEEISRVENSSDKENQEAGSSRATRRAVAVESARPTRTRRK